MKSTIIQSAALPVKDSPISIIRHYFKVAKWAWAHRGEKNCRQKDRRMLRELHGKKA